MLETLLTFTHPLLALLVITTSALVYGTALLAPRLQFEDRSEHVLVATSLGLGVIAQGLFILGMLGALDRFWVLAVLLLSHLLCHRAWRQILSSWRGFNPSLKLTVGILILLLPSFILTHYPPTGFDATVYHLPYVKAFLDAGALVFVEDLRFPIFPQVGEMGFVFAFLLEGETTAKLTQWLSSLLVAGLLWIQRRDRASCWAAALWLGTPLVAWISAQAYIDLSLTLFITASFHAWNRWQATKDHVWMVLTGLFAGLAAGTKYLALFWVLTIGILALMDALKRRRFRPLLLLVLATTLMMAPWYARLIYHTGNPVFPFYAPIFGASAWTSSHDRSLPRDISESVGAEAVGPVAEAQFEKIASGLSFLALLPWNAVFERDLFHGQAPLSPLYLLLIPLVLPFALRNRRGRRLLAGLLFYALFWLTTVRDLRFLLPALPIFHLALSNGLDHLCQRVESGLRSPWTWRFAAGMTVLFLLPGWGYGLYKSLERGPIPVGQEEREAYLGENIPGYVALQELHRTQGKKFSAYTLFGERLHYFAEGRLQGDWFGPAEYWRFLAVLDDPEALHQRLRGWDVCELILVDGPRPIALPEHPNFERIKRWDGAELYRLRGCQE